MKKLIQILSASVILASAVFGADFSKKSNEEILNLAKNVSAQDQAYLIVEMKKRMNAMNYKDAREFRYNFKQNLRSNIDKLSFEERFERKKIVRENMQKITDNMSGKQIRELGLNSHYKDGRCGSFHSKFHRGNAF